MQKIAVIVLLAAASGFPMAWWNDLENRGTAQTRVRLVRSAVYSHATRAGFAPDGKRIVLLGSSQSEVIDVASKRRLVRIGNEKTTMLGARFSPDGRTLATASKTVENAQANSFEISIWDADSGQKKLSLPVARDDWYRTIDDISFTSDGALLASNLGGVPRLWKTADGSEAQRFSSPGENWVSQRVLLTPNGARLAVYFRRSDPAGDLIRIWSVTDKTHFDLPTNIYRDWAFSPDSKLLAITALQNKGKSDEHSAVEIWEIDGARRTTTIEVPKEWRGAYVVSFSPDGRLVGIGGYERFGIFSIQNGTLLAEARHADRRPFRDTQMPNELTDIEFSPDGELLLTGGADDTVKLWNVIR